MKLGEQRSGRRLRERPAGGGDPEELSQRVFIADWLHRENLLDRVTRECTRVTSVFAVLKQGMPMHIERREQQSHLPVIGNYASNIVSDRRTVGNRARCCQLPLQRGMSSIAPLADGLVEQRECHWRLCGKSRARRFVSSQA